MNKPSYYYKYDFVSPESLYAEVKEELKTYFQTGVVDDLLFSRYTEDCLSRLGRSSFRIVENFFNLEDFETRLPENFKAVRELWLVTPHEVSYRMPTATYEQTSFKIDSDLDEDRCEPSCTPNEIKVTYKTTGTVIQRFTKQYLLKPGNIHAKESCATDFLNTFTDSLDTFDIRNGKIVTNFREGVLYLVYYAKEYDDNDYQLIPDSIRIKDYIKAYLKYKCFETIYNNISDETLNQVAGKLAYYEKKLDEAKEIAETEIKKQTIHKQILATKSARNRFNKFLIR
jgi:hypothetical protein